MLLSENDNYNPPQVDVKVEILLCLSSNSYPAMGL